MNINDIPEFPGRDLYLKAAETGKRITGNRLPPIECVAIGLAIRLHEVEQQLKKLQTPDDTEAIACNDTICQDCFNRNATIQHGDGTYLCGECYNDYEAAKI